MPPVNQGSRAALVVWTVITSFLFIVATIFAIYFYVDADSSRKAADNQSRKYNQVVREAELAGADVAALNDAKQNDPTLNPAMTAMQVALTQRDNLARKIAGPAVAEQPNSAAAAAAAANTVIGSTWRFKPASPSLCERAVTRLEALPAAARTGIVAPGRRSLLHGAAMLEAVLQLARLGARRSPDG